MPLPSETPGFHQFIIGLIGNPRDQKFLREIGIQMSLTHSMMQNKKAKIPGLEEVPVDRKSSFTQFVLDNELHLEEIPTAQRASQDRKSTDVKGETVVLHICGHHEPKEKKSQTNGFGFRTAHKDGFYKTDDIITLALAPFLKQFTGLKNIYIVLHSCETAVSYDDSDQAFTGSTMRDILSSLEKELQQTEINISIFGVEHEISEEKSGYTLWNTQTKKKVKDEQFKSISNQSSRQKEQEDLPSTTSQHPTITQPQSTKISKQ